MAPKRTMHTFLSRTLDKALAYSPLQYYFHRRAAHSLTVLAYHGIDDPETFEKQLRLLRTVAHPITVDELLDALAGRKGLPERAVLLTFDDGERTLFDVGMPLMKSYGIPGVAYVVSGVMGTHHPFWWREVEMRIELGATAPLVEKQTPRQAVRTLKQVPNSVRLAVLDELRAATDAEMPPVEQLTPNELRILQKAGIAIGNHTHSHPCLNQCNHDEVRREITRAHDVLTAALGEAPTTFAYPNGDVHEQAAVVLAEMGYQCAFLFDHRLSVLSQEKRFQISRIRVNSTTDLDRYRILTSGLHASIHHMFGRP
ncbi:polysaccharide deacetylase family protein [bacterium]|nr:polysaccharide deacetylase family protein [bacterium]